MMASACFAESRDGDTRTIAPVSDLSLFGDDEPQAPVELTPTPTPIADWQVDLLRRALDSRGLTSISDRREAIEAAAGRSVDSLRALTSEEAMRVLTRLGASPAAQQPRSTSSWDDRDEDTWIDRL